jgi:hypothetical protein
MAGKLDDALVQAEAALVLAEQMKVPVITPVARGVIARIALHHGLVAEAALGPVRGLVRDAEVGSSNLPTRLVREGLVPLAALGPSAVGARTALRRAVIARGGWRRDANTPTPTSPHPDSMW